MGTSHPACESKSASATSRTSSSCVVREATSFSRSMDTTIQQVAASNGHGFPSATAFARFFRHRTAETPTAFRARA